MSEISSSQKNYISIINADLTNKSKGLINSPRTIKACLFLGVSIEELYKPTFEEFKSKNPDLIHLSQEMLKFQYDGREKIRIKTVNRVKNERMKIVKAQQKNKKNSKSNTSYKNSKS